MKKTWAVCGCLVLLLTGCGDKQADQDYADGMAALKKQEYDVAIEEFNQVIESGERLPEAYRGLGIAWLEKESYPEAIAAFSRSLNNMDDPEESFEKDVMYYLAESRLAQGDVEKAIQVYGDILKKGEEPQAFFLRGKTYMQQKEYEKAGKDFDRALKDCKDYNLYINIYQIYVEMNRAVDGDIYLEQALALEPQTGEDYYHRSRIYEIQKNYDEAKKELIESMKLGYEDAMLLLGRVYLETDDTASARAMYQEYLTEGRNKARAYNGLAICDISEENYDGALEQIQKGLAEQDEEENQSLLYNEIVAYEYKKDFATAKIKMQEFLEKYPEDQQALRENEFLETR